MIRGADVSNWQGAPSAWRSEAGSIDFAGVKITELEPGGIRYVNPDAPADWAYLRDNGKGRIAYAFGHPSMPAATTAALLAATLRPLGVLDTDAIALDLETTDGLPAAAVSGWAQEVLGLLEREFSRLPLLYTFRAFAAAGNCAGLSRYPLWIADPSSPAGRPVIPAPWTAFAIHQYAWKPVDLDLADYPDLAAMQSALGRRASRPPEDPVLVLAGPGADTPVALPDTARSVRLVSVGDTTVSVEFSGQPVRQGVRLSWGHGQDFPVPAGSHSVRVYREPAGSPEVPVSVAVS